MSTTNSATKSRPARASRTLGVASLLLGVPAAVAPRAVARLVGLRPTDGTAAVVRGIGAQELSVGAALLAAPRPAFQWSRVAGDIAHLSLLGRALALGDVDRRQTAKTAAAVAGITLVDLATSITFTRSTSVSPRTISARTAVTVNRPVEEVYRFWRDLQNLPQFMYHLEEVRTLDERRSHWVAKAPAKRTVEWDAEITEESPNELIAWRSLEGARVPNAGTIHFAPAPADQGTEVLVDLEYSLPGGRIGAAVARAFGEEPEQQVRDDIRRFKQVMETGEVVLSDAIPDGTRTQRQLHLRQRRAQPAEQGKRS